MNQKLFALSFVFCLLSLRPAFAKSPKEVVLLNDLPAPNNLQATVVKKSITLNWDWQPPEDQHIPFTEFGYEIKRSDGRKNIVSGTTYSDFDLAVGTYSYQVRVRAATNEKGHRLAHVSDWSAPAGGAITLTCSEAPEVTVQVEPTKRSYSSIPSLRMHVTGWAKLPPGCSLTQLTYHVDDGSGIVHNGPLQADVQGHFDDYINAIGPDDEVPTDDATFVISVTAADEAGPTTPTSYSITLELQNPYAPRQGQ